MHQNYCDLQMLDVVSQWQECLVVPNWKLRPQNCLWKGDDGHARILISVQEMIIRWWKHRFSAEIVPNVLPERIGGSQ